MTVQQFLRYRLAAMFAWLILLVAAFAVAGAVPGHIENPALRAAAGPGILAAAVLLGLRAQRALLRRIDPDDSVRDAVRRGM